MEPVLHLEWSRAEKGYRLLVFDKSKVKWDYDPETHVVTPTPGMTEDEQRFLATWGMRLSPADAEENRKAHFLDAKSSTTRKYDVFAGQRSLFEEFANIDGDLDKLIAFVDRFGPLERNQPPDVEMYFSCARALKETIQTKLRKPRSSSKRWLEQLKQNFPMGFDDQNLKTSIKPRGDSLKIFFEPQDLLCAIWLQYVLFVTGGRPIGKCTCCGAVIASIRQDNKYCSDKCRQREYRARKKLQKH